MVSFGVNLSVLFYKSQNLIHLFADIPVVSPAMRPDATGAIFDPLFSITEIATAVFSQAIQRTIAENATEFFCCHAFVAGKIFAFFILKKIIMGHILSS